MLGKKTLVFGKITRCITRLYMQLLLAGSSWSIDIPILAQERLPWRWP